MMCMPNSSSLHPVHQMKALDIYCSSCISILIISSSAFVMQYVINSTYVLGIAAMVIKSRCLIELKFRKILKGAKYELISKFMLQAIFIWIYYFFCGVKSCILKR